jgi:hypothetical protein
MESALIALVCIAVLIVGMVTLTFNAFDAVTSVAESLKQLEEQSSDIRLTETGVSLWESDTVCAIAYQGSGSNGFVATVGITTGGEIAGAVTDSLEFDTGNSYEPSIIHVSDNVYAIAYRDSGDNGEVKTVEITADGQITDAVIDSQEFDSVSGYEPEIVHVSRDIYAIAHRGADDDGFLKTVEIAASGQITDTVIDTLEFDGSNGWEPSMLLVSSGVCAVAYGGTGDIGILKTVEIASDGQITDTVIDTLNFDSLQGREPNMTHISGNVYAMVYRGDGSDGFVTTVEIAANGQITDTVMDTFEFRDGDTYDPDIVRVSGDIYAITYQGDGSDGFVTTVEIVSNGQITDSIIDSLEFDAGDSYTPSIVPVSDSVYAIAYLNSGSDGEVRTVEIADSGRITGTVVDFLEYDTSGGDTPHIIQLQDNINLAVTNEGQTDLAEFAMWDIIAEYEHSGTSYLTYLEYTTDSLPGDNQWMVEGIYLSNGNAEVYDPGILNPGEKMKLSIDLNPGIEPGTTARITVSAPNGVASQCLVTRY